MQQETIILLSKRSCLQRIAMQVLIIQQCMAGTLRSYAADAVLLPSSFEWQDSCAMMGAGASVMTHVLHDLSVCLACPVPGAG